MTENSQAPQDETPATNASSDMRWYVVHVYSGMEKSVANAIRERIERLGMSDQFGEILDPTEKVEEVRGGKKFSTDRRFFPGYLMIQMHMTDDTWHLVKDTAKVTGFVGGKSNKPSPVRQSEMEQLLGQLRDDALKPKPKVSYSIGEVVRIKEGPFADFNGTVDDVNYEKSRLRVSVSIFGRSTPVELEFGQVEKN